MNSVMDLTLKFYAGLSKSMPVWSKISTFISKDGLFLRMIVKWTQNSSTCRSKISILEMNSIMDFIFAVLVAI